MLSFLCIAASSMLLWVDLVSPAQVVRAAPHHVELTCGLPLLWLPALSTVWGGDRETTWCDRIPNGAWFTPDHCQMQCCGSPRKVGTTPSRWLFQDPQRLDDHVQSNTAKQDIKLKAWRKQICPVLLFFICRTFLHYSLLDTLWLSILSRKRFYNLIHHPPIET